jgi:hypothetical protein
MPDGQDRVVSELRSIKAALWMLLGVAALIGWRLL